MRKEHTVFPELVSVDVELNAVVRDRHRRIRKVESQRDVVAVRHIELELRGIERHTRFRDPISRFATLPVPGRRSREVVPLALGVETAFV